MNKNLVDSCGWLEYFSDGENADFFAPVVENTEHLIVPTICITEVFKVLLRERSEDVAFLAISAMNQGRLVALDMKLAIDAAKLGLSYKLPLADSVVYATARAEKACLWTQDEHFETLPGIKYVKSRQKK